MLHLVCKQADSGPQAVCEAIGRVGKLLGDDWVLRTVGPWESNPQPPGQARSKGSAYEEENTENDS